MKVGIQTLTPKETFQIGDRFTFHNGGTKYIGYNTYYDLNTGTNKRLVSDYSSAIGMNGGQIFLDVATQGAADSDISFIRAMTVSNTGQVHIGIKKPTAAPYSNGMLTVDGSIVAKEIFVRDQQGAQWADYVFEKNYKLMNLSEVETYIKQNKHLPNVPSAKEIEEKGQGIGQLQVIQMEKTEELYLYLIELNKKVEKLIKENEELKEELDRISK